MFFIFPLPSTNYCLVIPAEREGRRSVPGAENNPAGRSTPGGPAAPSSTQGSSSRTSQNQTSIPAMAFQFHQHNHQHQHTHTHQHFTPFLTPATASPMVRETLLFYSCFKLHCSWNVLTHLNCFCLFSSISTQAKWTGCTDTL